MNSKSLSPLKLNVFLWLFGVVFFGVLIVEILNFFSDPYLIDNGLRQKIIRLFNRDSAVRIFFIGNYRNRIPFYFFFMFLPILTIFITIFKNSTNKTEKLFSSGFIVFLILALVLLNEYRVYSIWHKRFFKKADAFYKVQLWAIKNTKHDALFLIDPSHKKAWEEFSARSSFGTFRQWLHTSIIVGENNKLLSEGMRRTELIDKEIPKMLLQTNFGNGKNPPRSNLKRLVRKSFYRMGSNQLKQIAVNNEIDYVILLKRYHPRIFFDLKIAYENDYYIVYEISIFKKNTNIAS